MRVGVVGASGVVGRHLVPQLIDRGHQVRAIGRDVAKLVAAAAAGAEIHLGNILDEGSLVAALTGCEAAVHIATVVPRPGAPGGWAANDRVRREGTANLIAACRACGIARYVQQSIAMLVPSLADEWVDERSPVRTEAVTRSAADMEEQVQQSGLDWRMVRGGAFYGPGTGADEFWAAGIGDGSLKMPGDGADFMSLVHIADYAAALAAATEAATGGFTMNAVDDHPVRWRDFLAALSRFLGAPVPEQGGPSLMTRFRARNTLARELIGWRPFYASFRSGLLPML
ncbi:MAG: NAD(P)-dependent oxidoreductase [Rhizobiales bacterium]|nr:NAD(P)-dependent oxidoreductase [Hyphomicrobiales bacterium]MBI3673932.1 NAD(P)-dependent oxidoreductase [Hyphomicrobiales bacterium]